MSYLPALFPVILPITPIHLLLAMLIGLVSRIVCDIVRPLLMICRYAIEQTKDRTNALKSLHSRCDKILGSDHWRKA